MTPLRCLLFSSNAEVVQPIWQVLADLGIEGEYCQTAVDAVEKVTTQSFQIVITDWEDQPEAAFLLKTVRDLKAALRPLTLAIVSDDARRPQALQAGANSILLKPIRPEQLRDTMSTACELLRSKLSVTPSPIPTPEASATMAQAAAAAAGPVSMPTSVRQSPEKLRAGEFLQSSGSAPGAEFDTEREGEAPDKPVLAEIPAVSELEPMAAATHTAAVEPLRPQEALTGWAMLQARLTTAQPRTASGSPKAELLSYGQTRSYSGPSTGTCAAQEEAPAKKPWGENAEPEAKLFAYMPGEQSRSWEGTAGRSKGGKVFILAALAVVFAGLIAAPRTRQSLLAIYRNSVRAGNGLLNPPPAALPQAVTLHDSFGQSGDEYKLQVPVNIPDATTDPSQIRVLPVIDPTAKKKTDANTGLEQVPSVENTPLPQDQNAPNQSARDPFEQHEVPDAVPTSVGDVPKNATDARLDPEPAHTDPIRTARPAQPVQTRTMPSPEPRPATHYVISASVAAGIPSSLKSRVASSTPQASGSKPIEAAMSSIEPVNLPEPVEREFLIQPVDAVYPAATAKGQRGTVILQVLVGRDGSVQEAKFLQGSLLFARPAIDAVKQYRFRPYLLNGRPVSVQSIITLNFKPPA
ncbi:MAG TPA: energy transducer TonB [Candidatus Sulfotelmatobacter sp.]|nr:energy transducer TonB [Candidatus Sulfotelmatobacter sp.]